MNIKELSTKVAKEFNVEPPAIRAENRGTADEALARQVAMWVYTYVKRCKQRDTAEIFDRHPATVTHALNLVEKKMKGSTPFRKRVMALTNGHSAAA